VDDPVGELAVDVDVPEPPLAEEPAVGDGAGGEIDRDARRARAGGETTDRPLLAEAEEAAWVRWSPAAAGAAG
jgi:hypothetical protein